MQRKQEEEEEEVAATHSNNGLVKEEEEDEAEEADNSSARVRVKREEEPAAKEKVTHHLASNSSYIADTDLDIEIERLLSRRRRLEDEKRERLNRDNSIISHREGKGSVQLITSSSSSSSSSSANPKVKKEEDSQITTPQGGGSSSSSSMIAVKVEKEKKPEIDVVLSVYCKEGAISVDGKWIESTLNVERGRCSNAAAAYKLFSTWQQKKAVCFGDSSDQWPLKKKRKKRPRKRSDGNSNFLLASHYIQVRKSDTWVGAKTRNHVCQHCRKRGKEILDSTTV